MKSVLEIITILVILFSITLIERVNNPCADITRDFAPPAAAAKKNSHIVATINHSTVNKNVGTTKYGIRLKLASQATSPRKKS